MKLAVWVAERRRNLLEDLVSGRAPREGTFDEDALKEAKIKGAPQLGSVRFEPRRVHLEFVFSDTKTVASVFVVTLEPPERIVFLPVPGWVTETIWQGEIDGGYHFESDARTQLAEFAAEIEESANEKWFGPQRAKRRE
jgi:hypothetical protein